MNMEIQIPEDDPVRMASAQLEELKYRKLYRAYSSQGRKSAAEPRIIFEVLIYGYMCGIHSTRKLEEACRKRVDFMWLLQGEPVPDYTTFA
jgi:transposase